MLEDPKSAAFVENFAGQWLTLRKLANVAPDPKLFPEFDEELRAAMYRETELFFEAILREDRSDPRLPRRRLQLRQRAAGEALRHARALRGRSSAGSSCRPTAAAS